MSENGAGVVFDFGQKVVVVTGSTQGIGAEIAMQFALAGASVVVTGRNASNGASVVDDIIAAGGEAIFVPSDLTREESATSLIEKTVEHFSKIDFLINNAASIDITRETMNQRLHEVSSEDFDKIVKVALYGTFWCSKHALKYMVKAGKGSIINISSASADRSMPGTAAYGATKSAINSLTRGIAMDYADRGIRCNGIDLGFIDNGTVMDATRIASPEAVESMERASMLGRLGRSTEIADITMFLASDSASFVTGASWSADGGLLAKMPI